jgi:hypothetical protein
MVSNVQLGLLAKNKCSGVCAMDEIRSKGPVSFGLVSLQLQIKMLLEDCGGSSACELLDLMSDIPGADVRAEIMQIFTGVVQRFIDEGYFPEALENRMGSKIEEQIYRDILLMLHGKDIESKDRPFALLKGGKSEKKETVVDLESRRNRKPSDSPFA